MKKIILIIVSLIFFIPKVFAVTLSQALTQAYNNNPELNAERENIKVSEEDLNISKGEYHPTLTLSGSKSKEDTNKLTNQSGGDAAVTDVDPQTTSITIEQTLFDSGRSAEHEKNKIGIKKIYGLIVFMYIILIDIFKSKVNIVWKYMINIFMN